MGDDPYGIVSKKQGTMEHTLRGLKTVKHMIRLILNNNWSRKSKGYLASFFITAPILLQLLLTNNGIASSNIDRWIELKINNSVIYICWFLLSAGFIFLSRIKLTYLSLPIIISLAVATYILLTGENIEYEVWASMNRTFHNANFAEVFELVFSYYFFIPFLVLMTVFSLIYIFLLKDRNKLNTELRISKKYSSLLLIIGGVGLLWCYSFDRDVLYKTYPLSIPFYTKMYIKELYLFKKEFSELTYNFRGSLDGIDNANEIYILVIGETARKHSMSIYGYSRNTTPEMEKAINDRLLTSTIFNATSSGISTRLSVPLLISTANTINYNKLASYPTLIHVFNDLKDTTVLISNQEKGGRNNDTITLMISQMNKKYYISGDAVKREYDIESLPILEKVINEYNGRMFIILHLMGSHWDYSERYPPEFDYYKNGRVGSYDNSILYTDYILGKVLELMKNSNKPISMIYTSDHGENLNDSGDNNYLHAVKEMTEYEIQVPLFFSFNNTFYNLKKEKVERVISKSGWEVSHDNISHTILGLAGLYDEKIYRKNYDLSSENINPTERKVINRRLEITDVDDFLESKKIE